MRYFKKIENNEVVAFGTGGFDGIEIDAAEYSDLLIAHNKKIQAEKAARVYSAPEEEEAPCISMEERLSALEAALLEMLLGGE